MRDFCLLMEGAKDSGVSIPYLLSNHSECSLTRPGPSVVCKVCCAVQRSGLNSWKVGCEILTIKLKTEKQSKVLFSVDFIRVSLLLPALSNYLFLLYWGTCPACRCQTVNYFDKISGGCCINWVSLGDFSVTETDLFIAAIMELQSSLNLLKVSCWIKLFILNFDFQQLVLLAVK